MQGITSTRRMLEQNRSGYMALRGGLEDDERDALDSAVRGFISDAGQRIDDLKQMVRSRVGGVQTCRNIGEVCYSPYCRLLTNFLQCSRHFSNPSPHMPPVLVTTLAD